MQSAKLIAAQIRPIIEIGFNLPTLLVLILHIRAPGTTGADQQKEAMTCLMTTGNGTIPTGF